MNKLVIFGTGQIAELAQFYFERDSEYDVVAVCVDGEFMNETSFCGLPVVPFEEVTEQYSPDSHQFFVAVSYKGLNQFRAEKVQQAKAKGYRMASYLSSKATVFDGFELGENCFILEDNTIQPFARIGSNVTLWSGNHIGHHSQIHDDCFITSHVVISGNVTIGKRCFIGVNSTLRDGISIGEASLIGAGCLVMQDLPPDTLIKGVADGPAKIPASRIKL